MSDKNPQANAARFGALKFFNFAFAHFNVGALRINGKRIARIGAKLPGAGKNIVGEV
jgi:hypothetical protein